VPFMAAAATLIVASIASSSAARDNVQVAHIPRFLKHNSAGARHRVVNALTRIWPGVNTGPHQVLLGESKPNADYCGPPMCVQFGENSGPILSFTSQVAGQSD